MTNIEEATAYTYSFAPIYGDQVVPRTDLQLNKTVVFPVTRGLGYGKYGLLRQPTHRQEAIAPGNGLPQAGQEREAVIAAAVNAGVIDPGILVTTSGESHVFVDERTAALIQSRENNHVERSHDQPRPDRVRMKVHYGEIAKHGLKSKGLHRRPNGEARPIHVQPWSDDTFGEVAFLPQFLRVSATEDPEFAQKLIEGNGIVTMVSSMEQLPRLQLLRLFTLFQDTSEEGTQFASENADNYRVQLQNNPTLRYLSSHREQLVQLAQDASHNIDAKQVAKVLFLLDSFEAESPYIEQLLHPDTLKYASDTLFQNPRFKATKDRALPTLSEDMRWMRDNGIQVHDLTIEEIAIAMEKKGLRQGKVLVERLLKRWYPEDITACPLLKTYLGDMAGLVDLLLGIYYPTEDQKQNKALFEKDLLQNYQLQ
jgi:hypothetical protein